MKRILGVLISSVMLAVSCLTALPVSAKEEYTEYVVPFVSDKTKQTQVIGISNESLLEDGVIMIPLETACEIAGASIATENDEAVVITRNYISWCCEYKDEKNQYLLVDSDTGEGDYYESILKEVSDGPSYYEPQKRISELYHNFEYKLYDFVRLDVDEVYRTLIDYEYYNNKLYISFYEFLVMMGVDVTIIDTKKCEEAIQSVTKKIGLKIDDNKIEILSLAFLKQFGIKHEVFFSCLCGTPADELYKEYYSTYADECICRLEDYFTNDEIRSANISRAFSAYGEGGILETLLANYDVDTAYTGILTDILSTRDGSFINEETIDVTKTIQTIWNVNAWTEDLNDVGSALIEEALLEKPILGYDMKNVKFTENDWISIGIEAIKAGKQYEESFAKLNCLHESEKRLLENSILASETYEDKSKEKGFWNYAVSSFMVAFGGFNPDVLLDTENSNNNLYNSAEEVQNTINSNSMIKGQLTAMLESSANASVNTLLIKGIDAVAFSGVPVVSLIEQSVGLMSTAYTSTPFAQRQIQIANFDDYIFIQSVSRELFDEYELNTENTFSCFILGVKSSLTAYKSLDSDKFNSSINRLVWLLDRASESNREFYNTTISNCDALTGMLGNNTDISKLDTTSRQDITLEFGKETNEPTKSETINYEEIYYEYLINNFEIAELVDDDAYSHSSWNEKMHGLISATIYDFNNDGILELLTVTSEKSPEHSEFTALYLNLYQYNSENVVLLDKIGLNEYSAGGQSSDSVRLSISGNAIYQEMETNGRYASMGIGSSAHEYSVIGVSDYSFNKYSLFTDTVNIIDISQNPSLYHNGVYDNDLLYHDEEKCNQLKSEQWYYCDNKHCNYNLDYILNTFQNKYSDFGLTFSSLNIDKNNLNDCITISTSLEGAVPLCSLERTYPKLEIIDYTNFRDHIKAVTTPTITDISGRYSNDKLFVDVIGEAGSEGRIRVEYVHSTCEWSTITYQGVLFQHMSFDADDEEGTNRYTIDFRDNEINISIHSIECKNKVDPWIIPDINEKLPLTSKEIPNYDIFSLTNEMIVDSINNYLNQSDYWKQFHVITSDVSDFGVMLRYKEGDNANSLTNYVVFWGGIDDIAQIAIYATSGFRYDKFHLTEYLNAEVSSTNKVGKVVTENDALNVRQLPSTESEKIGTVDKGSTITILSGVNGWYEIEFNGKSGYVSGDFVEIID